MLYDTRQHKVNDTCRLTGGDGRKVVIVACVHDRVLAPPAIFPSCPCEMRARAYSTVCRATAQTPMVTQIRRGPPALSWYRVLDEWGEEQVLKCARRLAHNDTCFVVISDDLEARHRAFSALRSLDAPSGAATAGEGDDGEGNTDNAVHGVDGREETIRSVRGDSKQRVLCERDAALFHVGLDHNQSYQSEAAMRAGQDIMYACLCTNWCAGVRTHAS